MTENSSQQSATIYQFPVRARRTADSFRNEPSQLAARATVAGSGSWYHDAAIEEAKEATKQTRDH